MHKTLPSLQGEAAKNENGTLPPCLSFCGLKFPRLESLELRGVDLTFIEIRDWEFPQLMSLEVHHCYAGGIGTSSFSCRRAGHVFVSSWCATLLPVFAE